MKRFAIFMTALALAGCGGTALKTGQNSPATANSVPAATPASSQSSEAVQTVTIESADGVKLVGSMYAAAKPNSPALLLLHQWQSDRHSYDDFAKQMQARGFAVLSLDGRGFGESTKKADSSSVAAGRTDADVKAMLGDVDAAFAFLSKQPNVDPKRVGIVGASYGSSLALIYAADHENVGAVALLSPGLNYFGNMPTEPAIRKYGNRSALLIAAEDDKESADTVRKLNVTNAGDPRYVQKIFAVGGHGTALFKVGAAETASDFFAETLDPAKSAT